VPGNLGIGLESTDEILDFSSAEGDKIDFSNWDANSTQAGRQTFAFIGANAFSGSAGELRVEASGGKFVVSGDTDGDGTADFFLILGGAPAQAAPTAADFLF
jgi:Ca2+-binding RTX toxin-like protein